jgi:hypothetical protein
MPASRDADARAGSANARTARRTTVSLRPQAPIPLLVSDDPFPNSLPDKYPEQQGDDEDHEHERADRRRDAELQRSGSGVLTPAPHDAREAVLAIALAFLHERRVPAAAAP